MRSPSQWSEGVFRAATLVCLSAVAAHAVAADDRTVLAQGRALFTVQAVPSCALCHTLNEAGATGAVGPSLDDLRPEESRVAKALKSGIGAMPSYRALLSDEQITALAKYVAKASGASE